jgi:hypothetical protein
LGELVARGFLGTGAHAGSGNAKTWASQRELTPGELNDGKVYVKLGWTGSQWIPIQLFGVPNTRSLQWQLGEPPGRSI